MKALAPWTEPWQHFRTEIREPFGGDLVQRTRQSGGGARRRTRKRVLRRRAGPRRKTSSKRLPAASRTRIRNSWRGCNLHKRLDLTASGLSLVSL